MHKMHEGRLKSGMSAGDRTRERIMLAAEELVADVGPGGASARQIARIAGLKNNVSVQYHFGSMGKLFDEVIHYRGEMLEEIRQGMIDSYEKTDFEALSIEELWKIICLPQLKMSLSRCDVPVQLFACAPPGRVFFYKSYGYRAIACAEQSAKADAGSAPRYTTGGIRAAHNERQSAFS